ncbi:Fut1_Fut2_like domain containing protein [uncultured Caudovirales phage]|uniref:Fut1_Fut2_like domain containing protein n=1 Tax=uncultured Caudovirales phage TaxID=2100421 RepID=A0A6J5MC90_9CAUD|nr:Fut1_Fut2_like domain containing protein [uncultured Caudovirales phage]
MITYSEIGHFGRLGNQLFQFASTYGIARKQGYPVSFPSENVDQPSIESFKDGITREVTFDIPKAFVLEEQLLLPRKSMQISQVAQEPHFHFSEAMFTIPDNCDVKGYYQSEKYFKHVEQDLRKLLTFKEEIQKKASEIYSKIEYSTVSIHIRRGDYLGLEQFHPVCEPTYYQAALSNFTNDNYQFLVFSDDIPYCESLFGDQENILYINTNDAFVDLCLMSLCDHNIIANSSFSWWGAWLNNNKNKKVIAPKKWFGPAYTNVHDTKDLYCEDWIVI